MMTPETGMWGCICEAEQSNWEAGNKEGSVVKVKMVWEEMVKGCS